MGFLNKDFDLLNALQKADKGDHDAMVDVLSYLAFEGSKEKDLEDLERKYAFQLAEKEDYVGLIMLGTNYQNGHLVPKDPQKALAFFQRAADIGCSFGYECIGEMYFFGDGVEQDYQKAFEFFTKDEGRKAPITNFLLGEMYRSGLYLEKNDDQAIEYYLKVVNVDYAKMDAYYPPAAFRLAEYFYYDDNRADLERAWVLICEAKQNISDHNKPASQVGISKEMIDELWMRIFRYRELGETNEQQER